MTYDPIDTNGDGVVDAPVDNQSVKTGSVNNGIRQKEGETVQSAIDRASVGGRILLRSGTFIENPTVTTEDVTLQGRGRGTHIKGQLAVNAAGITVEKLRVGREDQTNNEGVRVNVGATGDQEVEIRSLWVEGAEFGGVKIFDGSDATRAISVYIDSSNVGGNDFSIEADGCLVDDIMGAVTDNGAGNVVGDTA
jgi:hypothetical protein